MAKEPEPSFEDALTRIERIVESLERGEPSLSLALARYEDGVQLLKRCYDLLDQAERSVALLTGVDEHGQPATAPFDASATPAREPDPITPIPPGNDTRTRTRERRSATSTRVTTTDPSEAADVPF
jgi:exodeoxyribonuclease VII small subunit